MKTTSQPSHHVSFYLTAFTITVEATTPVDFNPNENVEINTAAVQQEAAHAQAYELELPPGVFVGPNSFCDLRSPEDENCPAPKYFTDEIILQQLPTQKDKILQGLHVNQIGQLVCTDQEVL